MAEQRMKVSIVGRTPLLTHNPAMMGKSVSGPKGEKYIPTPEEESESGLYKQNGHFCFPGIGIRNSYVLASGAWKVKLPGSSRKMSSRSIMATTMVEPELVPILDPDTGEALKEYTIDTRRAVIQRQGILRSRPRFNRWRMDFEIVYDDTTLSQEVIEQLIPVIDDAGRRIGVGDYRPNKSGWFGTFQIRK